jgi:serine/threonine-protein kinase RsbW
MAGESASSTTDRSLTLSDPNDAFRAAEAELLGAVARVGYSDESVFAIRLALEEAVVNGFKHGNAQRPGATVDLAWSVDARRVVITVEDQGKGFDPSAVPDPRQPENLEKPSGRGLMLMRAYMTTVEHNEKGNRVRMVYERPC